ncbi:hypothetical protein [Variovorax sp.]|jgi:hypothetical protein|uniref:hypothetical protein n=1 Tax=Variovorax sp. TaxID=1871043 RepID=UPI0037DA31CE
MNSKNETRASFAEWVPRLSIVAQIVFASALLASTGLVHAFNSGSTGADGVLNPPVSTEIVLPPSGILQYTSINIPTGVTVTFKKNVLNTPVQLLVSGDVTIAGIIDLRGEAGKATGTAGDGNQADDGLPGLGGPGGFDGGRGGKEDAQSRLEVTRGGAGLGPGGGMGGYERGDGCYGGVYYHRHGGGGAFGGTGGSYGQGSCTSTPLDQRFEVAKSYGSPALVPLIGGSGGGGGRGSLVYPGSGGGGGGGAILIAASGTLTITGTINASGGTGGNLIVPNGSQDWDGGGGSGGAIKLVATAIKGAGTLRADGGCWNNNGNVTSYCSSDYPTGSGGRIRIEGESITYSGTSSPVYTTDAPGPIQIANPPSIRIASVGGTNVPATPTGNADVALPATITNPVTVNFETVNVPTGNTIKLRVVPAYGTAVEVLSPAITGTAASGTTSVSVTLPQGPSILQAITSYTVTVAQAESLSRFAGNERVESIELVASMGQESTAQLITASGKRYTVPASVLQLAGLAG